VHSGEANRVQKKVPINAALTSPPKLRHSGQAKRRSGTHAVDSDEANRVRNPAHPNSPPTLRHSGQAQRRSGTHAVDGGDDQREDAFVRR
jgi:hypothetical protein